MVAPRGSKRLLRLVIGAVCLFAGRAAAQGFVTVAGTVTDSTGVRILGARVSVEPGAARATTDDRGEFRLTGIQSGPLTLVVRRLGYAPGTVQLEVGAESVDGVSVRLVPLPTILAPVFVRKEQAKYTGRLAGYYERLHQRGGGVFITREQIDRDKPRMLTHLLQNVPGIRARRMRGGGSGAVMRGRSCYPLVWIDGTPMPSGEVDLDAISPTSIHGLELYLGSTSAPLRYQYNRSESSCGTILIWSRGPDTDPLIRTPRTVERLEQALASLAAYTAQQVDSQVVADPLLAASITYPPSLFASGVGGTVVAEFIVDESGHVQQGTIGIVSSPHGQLGEAVRVALDRAVFRPAVRGGVPVRQVVHQPFSFIPSGRRTAGQSLDDR